jgi:hypothetical protein
MATYTVTMKSTLYTVYEIEAETELEALRITDDLEGLCEHNSWTEDTEVYDIDEETED